MMPIIVRMNTPNTNIFMLLAILISLTGALGSTTSGEGGPRATTRCREAERHALLEIKENLHGRDVGFLSSWGIGDERRECCEWIGIRCDNKSGRVIRLDFSPSTLGRDQDLFLEAMKEIGSDSEILPIYFYDGSLVSKGLVREFKNVGLLLVWKGSVREFKNVGLLRNFDLSSNKLIGEIPNEVTELVSLVSLNLSRNNLSGEIPQKIGELKSLDILDLSINHLSGRIPLSLSQISGLSTLDLSNNNLSGKIPTGTQLQTRDPAAYFGNSELCGDPLSKKCPGEDQPTTSRATEDHDDDQNDEDQLITKGFYISSTVGFIVAFWGFCLVLIFNKSWRYRYLKSLNKVEDWVYVIVVVNKAKLLRIIKS